MNIYKQSCIIRPMADRLLTTDDVLRAEDGIYTAEDLERARSETQELAEEYVQRIASQAALLAVAETAERLMHELYDIKDESGKGDLYLDSKPSVAMRLVHSSPKPQEDALLILEPREYLFMQCVSYICGITGWTHETAIKKLVGGEIPHSLTYITDRRIHPWFSVFDTSDGDRGEVGSEPQDGSSNC